MSDRNTTTQDNAPSNLSPLNFTGVDRPIPVRPSLFRNNGGNVRSIRSANIYESAARSFHYPSNTFRGWRDATAGERPQANGSAFNPFEPIGIPSLTSVSAGPISSPGMTSVPSQPITPLGLVSASAEQGIQPIETSGQALPSVQPIESNQTFSCTRDVEPGQCLGVADSVGSSEQTSTRIEPIGPPGQTSARIQPIGPPGLTSGPSRATSRANKRSNSPHSKKSVVDPSEFVKFAVANSHLHKVAAQSSEIDRAIAETAMLVKAVVGNSKQGKNAPRACEASRRDPQRTQADGDERQYSEPNRRKYQASSTYVDELSAMFEAITMDPNRENSSLAHENRFNISICPHYGCDCYENRFNRCLKVHFDPIFNNNTDISLGDCSYLSTCFKGKNCKYVHYKVSLPERLKLLEQHMTVNLPHAPETNGGYLHHPLSLYGLRHVLSLMPDPQWINMDIRDLNFRALGNFHVVIADPSWEIHSNSGGTYHESTSDEYVNHVGIPDAASSVRRHLFLWVTGRSLEVGQRCLRNWGYHRVEEIVWSKTNQLGRTICTGRTGHWLNHSKEHVLLGIKGNEYWLSKKIDLEVIISAARERGRKPDELYGIAERLAGYDCRKLELFGSIQNLRPGWLTIGNELGSTHLEDSTLIEAVQSGRIFN